jgi:tetratricopeptide (TPR) repeat protein
MTSLPCLDDLSCLIEFRQSLLEDRIAWYERAAAHARQRGDRAALGMLLYYAGGLCQMRGMIERAWEAMEESLAIRVEQGSSREIAVTQHALAALYVQLGGWEEALALYEASLTTLQQLNDPREIAVTQVNLAQLLIVRGENLPRALGLLWEGYTLIERLKSPHEIQTVRDILMGVKSKLGAAHFDRLWAEALSTPQPDWLTSRGPKLP